MTNEELVQSKPKREDFNTLIEYEEALGWWNSHQGRVLRMRLTEERFNRPPDESQLIQHQDVMEAMLAARARAQAEKDKEK